MDLGGLGMDLGALGMDFDRLGVNLGALEKRNLHAFGLDLNCP